MWMQRKCSTIFNTIFAKIFNKLVTQKTYLNIAKAIQQTHSQHSTYQWKIGIVFFKSGTWQRCPLCLLLFNSIGNLSHNKKAREINHRDSNCQTEVRLLFYHYQYIFCCKFWKDSSRITALALHAFVSSSNSIVWTASSPQKHKKWLLSTRPKVISEHSWGYKPSPTTRTK